MSNNNKTEAAATNVPATAKEAEANAKRVADIQTELIKLDAEEAPKAQAILTEAAALHADPSGKAVNAEGKTEAQLMAQFNEVSTKTAEKRKKLEDELISLTKKVGAVADNKTLREYAAQRAKASQAACQEPPTDYSKFANPELDKIRKELQKNPLPGPDTASIDDGTGGEAQTPTPPKKA